MAAGAGVTITLSSVCPVQTVSIAYRPLTNIRPSHMFATLVWRKADPSPALQRVLNASQAALPTPDLSSFDVSETSVNS